MHKWLFFYPTLTVYSLSNIFWYFQNIFRVIFKYWILFVEHPFSPFWRGVEWISTGSMYLWRPPTPPYPWTVSASCWEGTPLISKVRKNMLTKKLQTKYWNEGWEIHLKWFFLKNSLNARLLINLNLKKFTKLVVRS